MVCFSFINIIFVEFGNIALDVGIDGVSLFRKSKLTMYPIVASVLNLPPYMQNKKQYITGLKLKFLKFCKVEKMIYFIEKIILKH